MQLSTVYQIHSIFCRHTLHRGVPSGCSWQPRRSPAAMRTIETVIVQVDSQLLIYGSSRFCSYAKSPARNTDPHRRPNRYRENASASEGRREALGFGSARPSESLAPAVISAAPAWESLVERSAASQQPTIGGSFASTPGLKVGRQRAPATPSLIWDCCVSQPAASR